MTDCAVHGIASDVPCPRCGTLSCPVCLARDSERWCPLCVERRPKPAWRAEGLSKRKRLWRFVWAITSRPHETGAAMKEPRVLGGLAFVAGIALFVWCVHLAFVVVAIGKDKAMGAFVFGMVTALVVGLWIVTVPADWLLLRLLGARVSPSRVFCAAAFSLAPLALTGWLPLAGVALGIPWVVAARIALLRGMGGTKTHESAIAVIGGMVVVWLALLAARLDLFLRT